MLALSHLSIAHYILHSSDETSIYVDLYVDFNRVATSILPIAHLLQYFNWYRNKTISSKVISKCTHSTPGKQKEHSTCTMYTYNHPTKEVQKEGTKKYLIKI